MHKKTFARALGYAIKAKPGPPAATLSTVVPSSCAICPKTEKIAIPAIIDAKKLRLQIKAVHFGTLKEYLLNEPRDVRTPCPDK